MHPSFTGSGRPDPGLSPSAGYAQGRRGHGPLGEASLMAEQLGRRYTLTSESVML